MLARIRLASVCWMKVGCTFMSIIILMKFEGAEEWSGLRDSLASLAHRMGQVQSQLAKKIDRAEVLSIVENRVTLPQLKRSAEEIEARVREERKQEEERQARQQSIAILKIDELGRRLTKSQTRERGRQLPAQELFLESSETMFSLLVEEMARIEQRQGEFERQLEARNRKVVALNNEVCRKLEQLEAEIEERTRMRVDRIENVESKLASSWSQIDRTLKPTLHRAPEPMYESVRGDMLAKRVQTLQQQLLGKANLKDLLPMVRQATQPLTQSVLELRAYLEESMDSTRKIMASQTDINREMSLGARVGWWLTYEQHNDIAIFGKELINLLPQVFSLPNRPLRNSIAVAQQGTYILRILPLHETQQIQDHSAVSDIPAQQFEVMLGSQVHLLGRETALRLDKHAQVRLIVRGGGELLLGLQKL